MTNTADIYTMSLTPRKPLRIGLFTTSHRNANQQNVKIPCSLSEHGTCPLIASLVDGSTRMRDSILIPTRAVDTTTFHWTTCNQSCRLCWRLVSPANWTGTRPEMWMQCHKKWPTAHYTRLSWIYTSWKRLIDLEIPPLHYYYCCNNDERAVYSLHRPKDHNKMTAVTSYSLLESSHCAFLFSLDHNWIVDAREQETTTTSRSILVLLPRHLQIGLPRFYHGNHEKYSLNLLDRRSSLLCVRIDNNRAPPWSYCNRFG